MMQNSGISKFKNIHHVASNHQFQQWSADVGFEE